ncbi:MAG: enoyl-CoA hydratase/isomerase family protein, partial [Planctomycetota bacterium]
MSELVTLSRVGDIGVITINNPPVNALSPGVPSGIENGVKVYSDDPSVKAIVLIGGGRTFIAGADINEFGKITSGEKKEVDPALQTIFSTLEECPKPVVAAIHG